MSADPQIRQFEKRIADETRVDQKNLDHAVRDMKAAQKSHMNAMKSADQAQHALDKAISNENKTAQQVNKAQHAHEGAVADVENAEKTLELRRQYQKRLEDDLQKRRTNVDEFQHRKDANDQFRETKLSEIHADAASRAGSRVNSVKRGSLPVGSDNKPGGQLPQDMRSSPEPMSGVANSTAGPDTGPSGAGGA